MPRSPGTLLSLLRLLPLPLTLVLITAPVSAQSPPPSPSPIALDAEALDVASVVQAVTVYRGRASVTRRATLDTGPGAYDLRFAALPETIQADTIQARVIGPARVLGVQFEQRDVTASTSPRIKGLDEQIEAARLALAGIDDKREVVRGQVSFIDAIVVRATSDASDRAATDELDIDAIRTQLTYVTGERTRLVGERRALEVRGKELEKTLRSLEAERNDVASRAQVERTAVVSIALQRAVPITIDLVYLVGNASWTPGYNIRAAQDGSAVEIEYHAMLAQRTGEDWNEVALTLSTAEPTVAANPPTLQPWFMDVRPTRAAGLAAPSDPAASAVMDSSIKLTEASFDWVTAGATVGGAGPSVTYALPRRVSVRSHARQQHRTRIAGIDAKPEFVHVAMPVLTDAVYIRGALTNSSPYQLLAGPASIFVGPDYVGPTTLEPVPPGGSFDLYFGIDQTVTTSRQLVTRKTTKTGLLGGGRKTSDQYRIAISNGAGKTIALLMWDRHPVSRTDEIQIEVVDLSHALSIDADYVEEDLPQGLMKWLLSVPPDPAAGGPSLTVTYGVNIARSKDIDMTPLP